MNDLASKGLLINYRDNDGHDIVHASKINFCNFYERKPLFRNRIHEKRRNYFTILLTLCFIATK